MLLTGDDYSKLIPYSKREANTLFAYVLDISEEKKNFLNEVAAKFGLDLVIKGANDDLTWDDSIEGWLSDIRDASMVVTDSFHGSVFSILFHRPFLSIVNYRRGAERFTSLLGKLGLNDRLVSTDSNLAYTTKQIDWDAVDAKLTEERILSYNFLKQAL
jgi:exopolysaccharide biosynthesis predicted pyruvyltransferase EpsI